LDLDTPAATKKNRKLRLGRKSITDPREQRKSELRAANREQRTKLIPVFFASAIQDFVPVTAVQSEVKFPVMAKRVTDGAKASVKKNYCFGCGADNPDSMRLKFTYNKKRDCVVGRIHLAPRYAGPPGYCHGGIIATILDEAMAKLNKPRQVLAVTGQMTVTYRRPVPLETNLNVEAREVRVRGRRRFRERSSIKKG